MSVTRKWDLSSDATKKTAIDEIIGRLDEILDEKIGVITAEDLLDIVIQRIGPDIYNQAVKDTKELVIKHNENLDIEIELLKQQP